MCKEQIFTIFGGTGDLTFRKLIPAFYNMEAFKNKDLCTQIVIIGRRDYTSGEYREMARRKNSQDSGIKKRSMRSLQRK